MSPNKRRYLTFSILVPFAIYAIFGLIMVSLVFNYLNQSSLTPEDERLAFFNYLIPLFLTLGFVIYLPISLTISLNKESSWLTITVIGFFAMIAIPWQIEHLLWQIQKQKFYISELTPYLICLLFTLATIAQGVKKLKSFKKAP
jgi:hypothetical protein